MSQGMREGKHKKRSEKGDVEEKSGIRGEGKGMD